MDKVDVTIIGAGVVGLAIAAELAAGGRDVLVVERHQSFGQEASSRNSEVIHAGIYYPLGSLRARLCVQGNAMLYELCEARGIPCRKLGKLLVAIDEQEEEVLGALLAMAQKNGVAGVDRLSGGELKELEPELDGCAALRVPSTGIIDTHKLMAYWESKAKEGKAEIAYGSELAGIAKGGDGYELKVRDADGEAFSFLTRFLVNSAGLKAEEVAALAGIDTVNVGYKTYYSKGEFFCVGGGKHKLMKQLIYPVPQRAGYTGLHTITDLQGNMKLGPYAYPVAEPDYEIDGSNIEKVFQMARGFLPFIEAGDLTPDMSGVQAKLGGVADDWHDFVISEESGKGLPGLINLVGIDSPGLTASPAIAKYVAGLIG